MTERSCGECYTCCVAFGITALKKYPMRTCKHLNGVNPTARCTIYDKRPSACSSYQCAWRQGWLKDTSRPDQCGFVLTPYEGRWYVQITDLKKSGDPLVAGPLHDAVKEVMETSDGAWQLQIVFEDKILVFKDGGIHQGKVLKPGKGKFEELTCLMEDTPIGRYKVITP